MEYISSVVGSMISTVFTVFLIASLGYLIGAIDIKGISLGTAGVLLTALLFGIFTSFVPQFTIGGKTVVLFDADLKSKYSLISSIGTALFVTSVGLIAGPKFFRSFNKATIAYVLLGILIIALGTVTTVLFICIDRDMDPALAVGLMAGALTSTPGLSAAKEVAGEASDMVTAGYGIAYLFGVLGVVFFVQLMPKILHTDMEKERENFVAANAVSIKELTGDLKKIEPFGFFPFFLVISLGCILGAIKIPGINFSLGNSGGCLLAGLLTGHFRHIGKIDMRMDKTILNFLRELGLVLFLIGAGVPGGVNFISNVKASYFVYGALITLVPMIGGFLIAKYCFRLELFNNLGAITGGMTSTPALGSLIATAGTDEVTAAYAATYPIALVFVVIAEKAIVLLM